MLIAFVAAEHLILALAVAINRAIPDQPLWVRVALAKADYESRQAVKREVAERCQRARSRSPAADAVAPAPTPPLPTAVASVSLGALKSRVILSACGVK